MQRSERPHCAFMAGRILPRLRAMKKEIDGVRQGTDPEHIHRMRVAARRIRSGMPLFVSCFRRKRYRKYQKAIRSVARRLGETRDTDVQIGFLSNYLHDHTPVLCDGSGVAFLHGLLVGKRGRQQEKVLPALAALERSGVIDGMTDDLNGMRRIQGRTINHDTGTYRHAYNAIRKHLGELLLFDRVVANPDNAAGHHAMRIRAKKLRYTLEIYRTLYTGGFRTPIKRLKRLQDLLGQIHDCDVWASIIASAISSRRRTTQDVPAGSSALFPVEPDLVRLLIDRKAERDQLHRTLLRTWRHWRVSALWSNLLDTVGREPVRKEAPAPTVPVPAAAESLAENPRVTELMDVHPGSIGHERQVARLSLMLFDQLHVLHGCSARDRSLLECAALLHDIGWAYGQRGHNRTSSLLILDDTALPLSRKERIIVALAARYHRKGVPEKQDDLSPSLREQDHQRVRILSALLRIADGLDYTHADAVTTLRCTISDHEVTCQITGEGDLSVERSRASVKSDLFTDVFQRRFTAA